MRDVRQGIKRIEGALCLGRRVEGFGTTGGDVPLGNEIVTVRL